MDSKRYKNYEIKFCQNEHKSLNKNKINTNFFSWSVLLIIVFFNSLLHVHL